MVTSWMDGKCVQSAVNQVPKETGNEQHTHDTDRGHTGTAWETEECKEKIEIKEGVTPPAMAVVGHIIIYVTSFVQSALYLVRLRSFLLWLFSAIRISCYWY